MCAIDRGKSIDTTMGFSPQSGLENATRHGDLDVFAVALHDGTPRLERRGGTAPAGAGRWSGGPFRRGGRRPARYRIRRGRGKPAAHLALDVFAYQVRKTIGAYAAAMGGLDAVAFTGGIGENSARLRAACCDGLEFLGRVSTPRRNENGRGDRLVSAADSRVAVLALSTNEELIVARRAYRCLAAAAVAS